MAIKDIEIIKKLIQQVHGDQIKIDESTYIGSSKKCRFTDVDYGEFWNNPSKVINRKQSHPKRAPEKARTTFIRKYGVDNPLKCKHIKDKIKNTCLDKYGVDNPSKNIKVQEKIKQTCLEKYGSESSLSNVDVRNKIKNTCLEKYGSITPLANKEIKEKIKNTCLETYGVDHPSKNKGVKEKTKQTCLEKYGVDNPSKNKDIINKIKTIIYYKYGCISSMQNRDVAMKNARSQIKSTTLYHWKDREELVCIGSYEIAVVNFLNANQIEFLWQPKVFRMPNGKTYRPDLYLIEGQLWVEIKGFFRNDAKDKWDWFHSKYKNSELWDKTKLKENNIL